ncbi:hypothetical protein [Nitrosomonas sp.]|uniref:hypothetical protein n=1 Tax=Nitrosomonas sp. TaxID=42353 RepID=UPI001D752FBD|nr:hypothetical protein [Nitrosomonas sp.]MBX3615688.1 hypothetical protein [Nitrosomonas sp.]
MKDTYIRLWGLTVLCVLLMQPAVAQQTRKFPEDSKLGELTAVSFPQFTIDGMQFIMGPGGQIRGVDNLIIMPSMANYSGLIRYQLDMTGHLRRVWFLTPDEVKDAESQGQRLPSPQRRFLFF